MELVVRAVTIVSFVTVIAVKIVIIVVLIEDEDLDVTGCMLVLRYDMIQFQCHICSKACSIVQSSTLTATHCCTGIALDCRMSSSVCPMALTSHSNVRIVCHLDRQCGANKENQSTCELGLRSICQSREICRQVLIS